MAGPHHSLDWWEPCATCRVPYGRHGIPIHLDGVVYSDHQWTHWIARVRLQGTPQGIIRNRRRYDA